MVSHTKIGEAAEIKQFSIMAIRQFSVWLGARTFFVSWLSSSLLGSGRLGRWGRSPACRWRSGSPRGNVTFQQAGRRCAGQRVPRGPIAPNSNRCLSVWASHPDGSYSYKYESEQCSHYGAERSSHYETEQSRGSFKTPRAEPQADPLSRVWPETHVFGSWTRGGARMMHDGGLSFPPVTLHR